MDKNKQLDKILIILEGKDVGVDPGEEGSVNINKTHYMKIN